MRDLAPQVAYQPPSLNNVDDSPPSKKKIENRSSDVRYGSVLEKNRESVMSEEQERRKRDEEDDE